MKIMNTMMEEKERRRKNMLGNINHRYVNSKHKVNFQHTVFQTNNKFFFYFSMHLMAQSPILVALFPMHQSISHLIPVFPISYAKWTITNVVDIPTSLLKL